VFFFFSSRRRHTRFSRDWSSDVCSSDLNRIALHGFELVVLTAQRQAHGAARQIEQPPIDAYARLTHLIHRGGIEIIPEQLARLRSEERRVGKACRGRGSRD